MQHTVTCDCKIVYCRRQREADKGDEWVGVTVTNKCEGGEKRVKTRRREIVREEDKSKNFDSNRKK